MRRLSFYFLNAALILVLAAVAIRPLRVPGVHQAFGAVLFAAIGVAAWRLGARAIWSGPQGRQVLALAGTLLIAPFAVMGLLWVGLGPPWVATAAENQMRYLVLIVAAASIPIAFVLLREALSEAGERFHSAVAFAAILLAGPMYLVWGAFLFGASFTKAHGGQVPQAVASLEPVIDLMLFLGGALTYLATAEFAAALGKVSWLGRSATRVYVVLNAIAFACLVIRGVSFPDPKALSAPWYTSPGFIAGIPAIPWIMPYLLGVVVLRRAGDEPS